MTAYNKFSVKLSAALVALWLVCMGWPRPNMRLHRGLDADMGFLVAYPVLFVAGIALVHSTCVAMVEIRRSPGARKAGWIHVVLWLALAAGFALPGIAGKSRAPRMKISPQASTFQAIESGFMPDFEKYYPWALAQQSTQAERAAFQDKVKHEAVVHARLAIMQSLQDKGVMFVQGSDEHGWLEMLIQVVSSNDASPGDKLQVLRWLLEQGKPLGFSARRYSARFSSASIFRSACGKVQDPATKELRDLLIAYGVEMTACTGAYLYP